MCFHESWMVIYHRASTSTSISSSRVIFLSTCTKLSCCFSKFFFFLLLFSLVEGNWCVSSVILCVCSVCVHFFLMKTGDAEKSVCSLLSLYSLFSLLLSLCLLSLHLLLFAGREGCFSLHRLYLPLCVCVVCVCVCLNCLLFLHLSFGMKKTYLDGTYHYP